MKILKGYARDDLIAICEQASVPQMFGGIKRSTLLATFVVQHATHSKGTFPAATGLTAGGRATKAASEVLR